MPAATSSSSPKPKLQKWPQNFQMADTTLSSKRRPNTTHLLNNPIWLHPPHSVHLLPAAPPTRRTAESVKEDSPFSLPLIRKPPPAPGTTVADCRNCIRSLSFESTPDCIVGTSAAPPKRPLSYRPRVLKLEIRGCGEAFSEPP